MTIDTTPFDQALANQITELLYSYSEHAMDEQRDALLDYIETHLDSEALAQVITAALDYQKAFTNH